MLFATNNAFLPNLFSPLKTEQIDKAFRPGPPDPPKHRAPLFAVILSILTRRVELRLG
jgi:hypothetical protein